MAAVEDAPAEAPFNRQHVDIACDKAHGLFATLCTEIATCKESLAEVAVTLHSVDAGDKVDQLRAEVRKLIRMKAELDAYQRAVQTVKAEYQPTGDVTDFKARLKQQADGELGDFEVDETHEWLRQLDEAMGLQVAAAPQELGSDDELQMEETTFLNATCPLSMLPLMDLQEPVQDQLGYVYEKTAILHHIQRSGGQQAECPVSGTRHWITASSLVPSRKVLLEQRRQRLLGAAQMRAPGGVQAAQEGEVVLDAD